LRFEENGLLAVDVQRSEGLPDTHGLHYRYAMSSYVQGKLDLTEKHLLEAHAQQPENPMYLMGLSTYFIHVKQPQVALKYIEPLVKMDSQHPGYRALADQANQMIEAIQTSPSDTSENRAIELKTNQQQGN
jgi:predicted Zn-dependent protease